MNSLNQLTTVTRTGTLTVAGTTSEAATSVTVNGSPATRYADNTFARPETSVFRSRLRGPAFGTRFWERIEVCRDVTKGSEVIGPV